MFFADYHCFKRPGRPPWAEDQEQIVFEYHALLFLYLKGGIILEHVFAVILVAVFLQLGKLYCELFRETAERPDLPVWVWIRTTHGGTFVFEYLHVAELVFW